MEYNFNDTIIILFVILGTIWCFFADYGRINDKTLFKIMNKAAKNRKEIENNKISIVGDLSENDKQIALNIFYNYIKIKKEEQLENSTFITDEKSIINLFPSIKEFHFVQLYTGFFEEVQHAQDNDGEYSRYFFNTIK